MMLRRYPIWLLCLLLLAAPGVLAQTPPAGEQPPADQTPPAGQQPAGQEPQEKPYEDHVKDAEKLEGLFTLYRQAEKLFLEVTPEQLEQSFIAIITLESGLGERRILSGMPLDSFVFMLKRVNDQVHFVRRNVHVRSAAEGPVRRAVERSFTDSVLAALKIEAEDKGDEKRLLLPLNLLLTDLPGLAPHLAEVLERPYALAGDRSHFGMVKAFPKNVEVESVLQFSTPRPAELETLPDGRHFTLRVRYSFSAMPEPGYEPRLADHRVGYFITAHKEFSDDRRPSQFIRYLNRWRLEKEDPSAPLSPPKEPIVFWLENAIPEEYRQPIREGVLLWNRAFEEIGFQNAIVVRQMPDDADWDPADVRYNVIRWITSSSPAFSGMGPSRVNPLTGEILDAVILLEGEAIRGARGHYRRYLTLPGEEETPPPFPGADAAPLCQYGMHLAESAAFGNLARLLGQGSVEVPETYIHDWLRDLTAHEVGHTLGLRHNFAGASHLSPEQLHDPRVTRQIGLAASIMDYTPVNVAPPGVRQGDHYNHVLGPYDHWAIRYGYSEFAENSEPEELRRIAAESGKPGHAFFTDEDMLDELDPRFGRWILSSDPLGWAKGQLDLVRDLWPRLGERLPREGETFADVRRAFETLYFEYRGSLQVATRYLGGQHVHRSHPGDVDGRPPLELVPAAKQRQALRLIEEYGFRSEPFRFDPELLNQLTVERYWHWGWDRTLWPRTDYPLHERVETLHGQLLDRLLRPATLARLRDTERRVASPEETVTLAELFGWLTEACWSELGERSGLREVDSFRRALQREHLERLAKLATDPPSGTPGDARALAAHELRGLQGGLRTALRSRRLDTATRAHLEDSLARIEAALSP